jgi:hypothetical protein
MALATLSVDLVAKMATFERDLGKAARASEQTANRIKGAFGIIKSGLVGLAAGVGVGGLIALTRASIDSIDALNDVADATGATIENISGLENIAKRTGTSLDTVATTLVKFNDALKNAKPDSNIAAALDSIGLSATALRNLDPAEALRQTAVALSQYADDGNKARLVQELFGRSVREVAPFLKDLAEGGKLVATVTAEQAAEADKFNKQLFAMQANLQDAARAMVGPMLTGLNGLIDRFREGTKAGEGFIVTLLRQTEIARLLGLAESKAANTGGATGSFATAGGGRGFVNPAAVRPSVSFGAAPGGPTRPPRRGPAARKEAEEITEAQRALASYVEGLSRALEKTEDLSEAEKALNFLRYAGTAGQVPQVRELVLGLAQQIDKKKELVIQLEREEQALADIDKVIDDMAGKEAARIGALDDQLNELSGRAGDDRKRALTGRLESQLSAGAVFSPEELDRIVRGIGGVSEHVEKTKTLAEDLGLSFTSAFEDAIVGGKKFSDVLRGLEQDILRIVTRKLVTEPLGNAITGMFSGGGGGGGGIGGFLSGVFGKLFNFEGGGFTGYGPRLGGLDGRGGQLAMVHPNETVIDHSKGQRMPGRSMVININPPAGMNRQASSQFAADVARQLRMADARNG